MFTWLKYFFTALLNPSTWIQNNPYSAEWDAKLKKLLLTKKFKRIGHYTAMLGDCEIWIANHPYSSFRPSQFDIRPRRATILQAHRKMMRDYLESINKK